MPIDAATVERLKAWRCQPDGRCSSGCAVLREGRAGSVCGATGGETTPGRTPCSVALLCVALFGFDPTLPPPAGWLLEIPCAKAACRKVGE